MIDEDPSPEDIERFGDDTAYCPDCGAKVWDEADICPKCHAYLGGDTSAHPPVERSLHKRLTIIIIILTLIAFAMFAGLRIL